MDLFKKKEKVTVYKSVTQKENGDEILTQYIQGKVIEVGDDEAEDGFSYKYTYINPLTNKMEQATDYVKEITEGEQLFDVGEDVGLIFTNTGSKDVNNFIVTRQMIFPDILKRKKRIRIIKKTIYWVVTIILTLMCFIMSMFNQ